MKPYFNTAKNEVEIEVQYHRDIRLGIYVVYFFCIRDLVLLVMTLSGFTFSYNYEMDLTSFFGIVLLFMLALGIKHFSVYSSILLNIILLVDFIDATLEINFIRIVLNLFWLNFTMRTTFSIIRLKRRNLLKRSLVTYYIVTNSIITCLFLLFFLKQFS